MASKRPPVVVVIGELFIDEILSDFQTLPKLGEEAFARKHRREVGGGAAITACGLAKLGVNVRVIGMLGKADSGWVLDRLQEAGVDCSTVEFHPEEATGLTVSVSTHEDRAFFTYYGANRGLRKLLAQAETLQAIRRARHIHFACAPDAELDAELLDAIDRKHCRVSIDVQSHISWLTRPESLAVLRNCDMFFPNEREAEWISGETGTHQILRELRQKGLRGVGLKLGGKGAALLWRKREFLTDAFPAETVDTTGAGDCFDAGFIYAWLHREKPPNCLEIANICGALSTRELGGIQGFPTLEEIRECRARLTMLE
jgi:sugar/nucleoside kinase (ribokinase family)